MNSLLWANYLFIRALFFENRYPLFAWNALDVESQRVVHIQA